MSGGESTRSVATARAATEPTRDVFDFENLFRRYERPVKNRIFRRVGDPYLAEDLTQETFLRAWRYLPSFDQGSPPGPWLNKIASNVCIDWARRPGHSREVLQAEIAEDAWLRPSAEEEVLTALAEEEFAKVTTAMSRIARRHRRVLMLRHVAGMRLSEIATSEGIGANGVKALIRRAGASFRHAYEQASGLVFAPFLSAIRNKLVSVSTTVTSFDERLSQLPKVAAAGVAASVAALAVTASVATPPPAGTTGAANAPLPNATASAETDVPVAGPSLDASVGRAIGAVDGNRLGERSRRRASENARASEPGANSDESRRFKVVAVEDTPASSRARSFLSAEGSMEVIPARNWADAAELAEVTGADLILLSDRNPSESERNSIQRVLTRRGQSNSTRVLIFTGSLTSQVSNDLIRAGADGTIPADAPADVILESIRGALRAGG